MIYMSSPSFKNNYLLIVKQGILEQHALGRPIWPLCAWWCVNLCGPDTEGDEGEKSYVQRPEGRERRDSND